MTTTCCTQSWSSTRRIMRPTVASSLKAGTITPSGADGMFAAKLNRVGPRLAKLLSVKLNRARWRGGSLTVWFLLAMGLVFVAAWHRVFLGDHVLVGGDVLYSYPPWNGSPPPPA